MFQPPPPPPMAMPSAASGPTKPPIFIGHLGKDQQSNGVDKIESLGTEIAFRAAYILEGIHIVPNKVIPPGFNVEGRTLPDLQMRPFVMELYARDIDNPKDIFRVTSLTVRGGDPWIRLPDINTIAIDYVVFKGDFETLTVIIHGSKLDSSVLLDDARRVVAAGPPATSIFAAVAASGMDMSDEEDNNNEGAGREGQPFPKNILRGLRVALDTYHIMLKGEEIKSTVPPLSILDAFQSSNCSKGACLVSIDAVAELIDAIFSKDVGESSSIESKTEAFNSLADTLGACWRSAEDLDKTPTTHDRFSIPMGEDAASVLANMVMKGLDCVRTDLPLPSALNLSMNPQALGEEEKEKEAQVVDQYRALGTAVLRCCSAMLVNELIAIAFAEIGGLSILSFVARQAPQLPPNMQALLLECLLRSLQHVDLLPHLIEPPEIFTDASGSYATDVSVYQTLLLALGNMKETAPAAGCCGIALNWCSLVESCAALRDFASDQLPAALGTIVEANSRRLAAANAQTAALDSGDDDQMDDDTSKGAGGDCGMHGAATLLHDIALICEKRVKAFQSALLLNQLAVADLTTVAVSGDLNLNGGVVTEDTQSRLQLNILDLLHSYSVIPSMVAVAGLARAAAEAASLVDWDAPYGRTLAADSATCRTALVSTMAVLYRLKVAPIELLLASNSAATHMLWQILSQEEQAISCQPLYELHVAYESCGSLMVTDSYQTYHPASIGWTARLSCSAISFAEKIVAAAQRLPYLEVQGSASKAAADAAAASGSSADKNRYKEDETILTDAVKKLNDLTYSVAGTAAVCRVVAQFCLWELVCMAKSFRDSEVNYVAVRLVALCVMSEDLLVIDGVRKELAAVYALLKVVKSSLLEEPEEEEEEDSSSDDEDVSEKQDGSEGKKKKKEEKVVYSTDAKILALKAFNTLRALDGVALPLGEVCKGRDDGRKIPSSRKLVTVCRQAIKDFLSYCSAEQADIDSNDASSSSSDSIDIRLTSLAYALDVVSSTVSFGDDVAAVREVFDSSDLVLDCVSVLEVVCCFCHKSELFRIRYGEVSSVLAAEEISAMNFLKPPLSAARKKALEKEGRDRDGGITAPTLSKTMEETRVLLRLLLSTLQLISRSLQALHINAAHTDIFQMNDSSSIVSSADDKESKAVAVSPAVLVHNRLLNAVLEVRAAALAIVGVEKAGTMSSDVRSVCNLTTSIYALYCPSASSTGASSNALAKRISPSSPHDEENDDIQSCDWSPYASIVSYLSEKIISRPAVAKAALSLLLELVPSPSTVRIDDKSWVFSYPLNTLVTSLCGTRSDGAIDAEGSEEGLKAANIRSSPVARYLAAQFEEADGFCQEDEDAGRVAAARRASSSVVSETAQRWERFLWRKAAARIGGERVPLVGSAYEDTHSMEDLLKDVIASAEIDPLVEALSAPEGEERINVSTAILYAMASSSPELHQLAQSLCVKCMSLGGHTADAFALVLSETLKNRVALTLLSTEKLPSNGDDVSAVVAAALSSLCRTLCFVDTLCVTDVGCLALVHRGVLASITEALSHSDRNVATLALQLVGTINKSLLRISAAVKDSSAGADSFTSRRANSDNNVFRAFVTECVSWIVRGTADSVISKTPSIMYSLQDAPNGIMYISQASMLIATLPSCHSRRFIESISKTMTIEGLAVRLWLAVEDCYQTLNEITELKKCGHSHPDDVALQELIGTDNADAALQCAHMMFACAIVALKSVVEFTLIAFLDGAVPLATLAKSCRCSLSDPKRVMLRLQRAYTMWAVKNTKASSQEGIFVRSATRVPFVSHTSALFMDRDSRSTEAYDARHAVITWALRCLVDSSGRVARLVGGRDSRSNKSVPNDAFSSGDLNVDYSQPFSSLGFPDVLQLWFDRTPFDSRSSRAADTKSAGDDVLHSALRRNLFFGDETDAPLFGRGLMVKMDAVVAFVKSKKKRRSSRFSATGNDSSVGNVPGKVPKTQEGFLPPPPSGNPFMSLPPPHAPGSAAAGPVPVPVPVPPMGMGNNFGRPPPPPPRQMSAGQGPSPSAQHSIGGPPSAPAPQFGQQPRPGPPPPISQSQSQGPRPFGAPSMSLPGQQPPELSSSSAGVGGGGGGQFTSNPNLQGFAPNGPRPPNPRGPGAPPPPIPTQTLGTNFMGPSGGGPAPTPPYNGGGFAGQQAQGRPGPGMNMGGPPPPVAFNPYGPNPNSLMGGPTSGGPPPQSWNDNQSHSNSNSEGRPRGGSRFGPR